MRLAHAEAPAVPGVVVREAVREELASRHEPSQLSRFPVEDVDALASGRWRCFIALDGDGVPVSRGFVMWREGQPHLFRAETVPARRGERIFRSIVASIAEALARDGERWLTSTSSLWNRASVRAHLASGFESTSLGLTPVVLGRRVTVRLPMRSGPGD